VESFELKSIAAWLEESKQALFKLPPSVLCEGTHPMTGKPNTPILLAPRP